MSADEQTETDIGGGFACLHASTSQLLALVLCLLDFGSVLLLLLLRLLPLLLLL